MTATRVRAYTPNGASLGPLPTPSDLSVSYPLNDLGALTLAYLPDAPRADLLGKPLELAVEVSTDEGRVWVEPPNSRFLYLRDGRDPIQTGDAFAVEGVAYAQRMAKALVGFTGLNSEGARPFTNATPGAILHTLLTQAQARGALAGFSWDFTAAVDSSGRAWPETVAAIAYDPGDNLLGILTGLVELALVDFRTNGRTLQVYVDGSATGLAADRSVGAMPVVLRAGRDLVEAPFRRTWEALADTAMVKGDDNTALERTNAAALKPWGRQETYVTAAGSKDSGTLAAVGDAALELTASERIEHTMGLEFGAAVHLPFRDYAPGEWVMAAPTPGAPQRMRVRQVTLTRGENGATTGNVVLNDRFLESDVLTQRRLNRLTGGATAGGTGTTPGSGQGNDILAPAKVGVVTTSSSAYVESDGRVRAQVTLDWPDVTTNADGSPSSDVAGYEVEGRYQGVETWRQVGLTQASIWSNSPYDPREVWEFRVRAVDNVYNRGAWSDVVTRLMASDTSAPGAPSAPTATSRLGVARLTWDGKGANDAAMPPDFAHARFYVSTGGSAFAPSVATEVGRLGGAGVLPVTGLAYGTTYWARVVAYDTSGNPSAPSAAVEFTVASLADSSNFPDNAMEVLYARTAQFINVTADMIEAGAIDGQVITGALLRTAEAGQRVQLDAMGLHGFGPDGAGGFVEKTTIGSNGILSAQDATLTGTFRSGTAASGMTIGPQSGGLFQPGYTFTENGDNVYSIGYMNYDTSIKGVSVIAMNHYELNVGPAYEANFIVSHNNTYPDNFRFQGKRSLVAVMDGKIELWSKNLDLTTRSGRDTISTVDRDYYMTAAGNAQLWSKGTGGFNIFTGTGSGGTSIEADQGGAVYFRRHKTGTASASAILQSGGQLLRSTSRRDAKIDPQPITLDRLKRLLAVPVVKWIDRAAAEDYADMLNGVPGAGRNDLHLTRVPGMIAEDVEATGLTEFVAYSGPDDKRRVEGLSYDRIGVAWVPMVADLYSSRDADRKATEALAKRVAELERTTVRIKL